MEGHEAAAGSSSSSSWSRKHHHGNNSKPFPQSPVHHHRVDDSKKSKVEDSDEDMFTVPDVEGTDSGGGARMMVNINEEAQPQPHHSKRRSRGRNPADKEYRRLKRLLRNRVSAQQARERKKVYVNELEGRAKDLQDINSKLEEKISTLINENNMLRKVLLNTRPKVDDNIEPKSRTSN